MWKSANYNRLSTKNKTVASHGMSGGSHWMSKMEIITSCCLFFFNLSTDPAHSHLIICKLVITDTVYTERNIKKIKKSVFFTSFYKLHLDQGNTILLKLVY